MPKQTSSSSTWFIAALSGSLLVILIALSALMLHPNKRVSVSMMPFAMNDEAGVASSGASFSYGMGRDGMMATQELALDGYKTMMPSPSPMPPVYGGRTAAEAEQRIIKTADLSIAVSGVEARVQELTNMATGRGGFVQSSTIVEDQQGNKNGYITIRVPSETFEDTISAIKQLAVRVERESINGQDVTEQYTDIEARLRSAKAQEEQYFEILDRAQTVEEILAVQQYLQNIRYEIESLQGQLDSLGNQTEYSTISVSLKEDVRIEIPTAKFDLGRDIRTALHYVVVLAQAALTFLVWFVIVGGAFFIPLAALIGLAVWGIKKIVARL